MGHRPLIIFLGEVGCLGKLNQWSGAGVGVGRLRGDGDSLT